MPPKGWKKYPEPGYVNTILKSSKSTVPKKSSTLRHSLLPPSSTNSSPNKLNTNTSNTKKNQQVFNSPAAKSNTTNTITNNNSNSRGHRSPTKSSHMNSSSSPTHIRRVGPNGVPILSACVPSELCAFCEGPTSSNQFNRFEAMVSCWECGSSGHPTCLDWADMTIVKKVEDYCWLCQDCKRCSICDKKGEDDAEEVGCISFFYSSSSFA